MYLPLCPIQGKHYLSVLLSKYTVETDEQATYIAAILKEALLHDEAKRVLRARANYWYRQLPYQSTMKEAIATNRRRFGSNQSNEVEITLTEEHFNSIALGKSCYFYQLAGDYVRLSILIECVFYHLQHAVAQSVEHFHGLHILPGGLYPPLRDGELLVDALKRLGLQNTNEVSNHEGFDGKTLQGKIVQ